MVSDKAEKNKKINLKSGRYIRFEAESRLARVNEEYDLLRKFSNFHYCSMVNADATIIGIMLTGIVREPREKEKNLSGSPRLEKIQNDDSLNISEEER